MNNTTKTPITPPHATKRNGNTSLHQNQTLSPSPTPKANFPSSNPLPSRKLDTTEPPVHHFVPSQDFEQSTPIQATGQKAPTAALQFLSTENSLISPQEEMQNRLVRHKRLMQEREIGDDGYYLSRQYKEDIQILYKLEQSVKELSQHKKG